MKKRKGNFLMTIGLLLLAAALGLTGYNLYESKRAQKASDNALAGIQESIAQMEEKSKVTDAAVPDYIKFPEKEMPSVQIDGERYIGILEIQDLGVSLPVLGGEWSYSKLNIAPCRYAGSVYEDSLVVAAHNYSSHFGRINNLELGSMIRFTDIDGNVFEYKIGWVDVLQGADVDEMKDGEDWDLTLFTCTYSGRERYTVRCVKSE